MATNPAALTRYPVSNGRPTVHIERENGRVVAVYIDQFLIRGVRAIEFQEALSGAPVLKLEVVLEDIVVADSGAQPMPPNLGSLAARVEEGAYLIGSGPVPTCDSCGMREHEGACT